MFVAKVKKDGDPPSCFTSHTINKYLSHGLCSTMFVTFMSFLVVISLLKIASRHSAEVLSSVSKQEGCDMPYGENMFVR